MTEEDKIHINSFKFYDRNELEELTKEYYLKNQQIIYYLKEKKEEYIKLYNVSCDIIDFDRYECLKILCEEILSKIEKE